MFKGEKWLRNASYLTPEEVERAVAQVKRCQEITGERAGVRCPSYIGEPHPYATIIYGPGQRIYGQVYRGGSA